MSYNFFGHGEFSGEWLPPLDLWITVTNYQALPFHGGVKRIRPAYFVITGVVLFVVIVIDTTKVGLIAPGVLARISNATNYVVKMEYRNVLNNRRNISSFAISRVVNTLFLNATSFSSKRSMLNSNRAISSTYNTTKHSTVFPKTSPFATTSVIEEHKQSTYIGRGNNTIDGVKIKEQVIAGFVTTVPRVVTTVPRVGTTVPQVGTIVLHVGPIVPRVITTVRSVLTTVYRVGTTVTTDTHNYTQVATPAELTKKLTISRINQNQKNLTFNQKCSEEFKLRHLMTVGIMGRTGNQLFQLCTLIATADDACFTAFLSTKQKIDLDSIFDIGNVVRKYVNISISNFRNIGEQGWSIYDKPIVKTIDPHYNVTLFGYFQAFKHFQHKKDLCRSSFVFKQVVVSDVLTFFNNMSLHNKTKIGIHIRRGDFVTEEKKKLGYLSSSKQFIMKAIEYFTNILTNTELAFIIVSDNMKWCKENIKSNNVYYSPFQDVGRDLNILTQCKHNVITSGSFGWMGAWLNETGAVVYDKSYPKYNSWLSRGHRKEDYYPSWWVGL